MDAARFPALMAIVAAAIPAAREAATTPAPTPPANAPNATARIPTADAAANIPAITFSSGVMFPQFLARMAIRDMIPDTARTSGLMFDTVLTNNEMTRSPIPRNPPSLVISPAIPATNSENFHAAKKASTASVMFSTSV